MQNRIKNFFDHNVHDLQLTIDIMTEVGVQAFEDLHASQDEVAELAAQVERLESAVNDQDEIIKSLFNIVNADKFFNK